MAKAGRSGLKRVPRRTCVVCRESYPKRELVRLVYVPHTGVRLDPTGKASGRGAYLCHKPTCWVRAANGDFLEKGLRVTLTQADRNGIAEAAPKEIGKATDLQTE